MKKNSYNPFSVFDLCKWILVTEHGMQNMWHLIVHFSFEDSNSVFLLKIFFIFYFFNIISP